MAGMPASERQLIADLPKTHIPAALAYLSGRLDDGVTGAPACERSAWIADLTRRSLALAALLGRVLLLLGGRRVGDCRGGGSAAAASAAAARDGTARATHGK